MPCRPQPFFLFLFSMLFPLNISSLPTHALTFWSTHFFAVIVLQLLCSFLLFQSWSNTTTWSRTLLEPQWHRSLELCSALLSQSICSLWIGSPNQNSKQQQREGEFLTEPISMHTVLCFSPNACYLSNYIPGPSKMYQNHSH